jgi:FixJ family two-component response regulator
MVRIALIDDDLSMRKAISRLLRTHGYSCSSYESGEEALADPELLHTDCMVVDVQLGGINGVQFCERVSGLGLSIPHIFITAYVDRNSPGSIPGKAQEILLLKPFDEGELITAIQRSMHPSD